MENKTLLLSLPERFQQVQWNTCCGNESWQFWGFFLQWIARSWYLLWCSQMCWVKSSGLAVLQKKKKEEERNVLRHVFLRNGYISLAVRANETSLCETKACTHAAEEWMLWPPAAEQSWRIIIWQYIGAFMMSVGCSQVVCVCVLAEGRQQHNESLQETWGPAGLL